MRENVHIRDGTGDKIDQGIREITTHALRVNEKAYKSTESISKRLYYGTSNRKVNALDAVYRLLVAYCLRFELADFWHHRPSQRRLHHRFRLGH